MMNIMISATIIAYTLYTFTVYERQDEIFMMASIPFVVYGVFRYMLLVHRDGGGNPDTLLLSTGRLQVALSCGSSWSWRPSTSSTVERLKRNLVPRPRPGRGRLPDPRNPLRPRPLGRGPEQLQLRPDTGHFGPRLSLLRGAFSYAGCIT
jgi:hypothetical protein